MKISLKAIIAAVLVIILTLTVALLCKAPLNSIKDLENAVISKKLEIFSINGTTYYPDGNGKWASIKGNIPDEHRQNAERNFIKLKENRLRSLENITIPKSYEEMMLQFSEYDEEYAYSLTLLLMVYVEYPEYFLMPEELLFSNPYNTKIFQNAVKIYNSKRLNIFQKHVIETMPERLDILSFDISGAIS